MTSLQNKFAPKSICFGCGPANAEGLQIQSFSTSANSAECTYTTSSHQEAFPGMVNGGILGTLLDCHSNWTAAWTLMNKNGLSAPPCTVTAYFNVSLLKPTPSLRELKIVAQASETKEDRVTIDARVFCGEIETAQCKGLFVAVKEGHPAYHRWDPES